MLTDGVQDRQVPNLLIFTTCQQLGGLGSSLAFNAARADAGLGKVLGGC